MSYAHFKWIILHTHVEVEQSLFYCCSFKSRDPSNKKQIRIIVRNIVDSEWSDKCIDFTMTFFFNVLCPHVLLVKPFQKFLLASNELTVIIGSRMAYEPAWFSTVFSWKLEQLFNLLNQASYFYFILFIFIRKSNCVD